MSSQTTNLELIKPAYTDTADIGDINDNMDSLDTAVSGKKDKQTAVTDPTASGTALTFIDTLSQNANGVITPTKKSVKGMVGATGSANGAAGLVTQPLIADKDKFLKGDGTWATPPATTYNEATSSAYGLVKIGYNASGKNYPVQLSSGKMYVNVPWTDNNTTYSQASSSALGLVKIGYSQNGKNYPVVLDANGKMYVNVPWTDNNTTYSEANGSTYGLVKTGYSANGKNYAVQLSSGKMYVNVPWTDTTYSQATSSALGLVKIGYSTNGKNYAVQLSDGKMYVNVPWTDTNTTYSNFTSNAAGLVPSPAGGTNKVLKGSGGWANLQDIVNAESTCGFSNYNGSYLKVQFRYGYITGKESNMDYSASYTTAFPTNTLVVLLCNSKKFQAADRLSVMTWDKNGFTYNVFSNSGTNMDFCYLALGY